jgi:glycosyltransferase involved in cell wall biosynthesis
MHSLLAVRVLVDTTFALRGPSGTGVYLERLVAELLRIGVDVVEAANDGRRAPGGGRARSVLNLGMDAWWTNVELPRRAVATDADVLHHPLPARSLRLAIPQVITVHDLAFERIPECFDPAYRRFASVAHRSAARAADAVVCVSQTTAADVRGRWGVDPERIVVAPHGPGQDPDAERPRGEPEHLLYVGDDEPRKNLDVLMKAHRRHSERTASPIPLVLAGTAHPQIAEGMPEVQIADRPDSEQLASLYAGAIALVHPSLHEGFGLTVLEAMNAGVPVLAARSPGVVETGGDAVLYFDPYDDAALADLMERVASDSALRRDLTERGRRQAAEFSWARSARRHLDAYTVAVR